MNVAAFSKWYCAKGDGWSIVKCTHWCLKQPSTDKIEQIHMSNHDDNQTPLSENTTDTVDPSDLLPLDEEQAAYQKVNQPYKQRNGEWSDGGNDTHDRSGKPRSGWKGTNSTIQKRRWLLTLALSQSVGLCDVLDIMNSMVKKAKGGDRHCAELVLKYTIGDPVTMELLQRMQVLESAAGLKGQAPTDVAADEQATEILRVIKAQETRVA